MVAAASTAVVVVVVAAVTDRGFLSFPVDREI